MTLNVLDELESVSGSNAKLLILKKNRDDADLKWLLSAATDPYAVYNVGAKIKTPKAGAGLGDGYFPAFRELIGKLSTRQVTGNASKRELDTFLSSCSAIEQKWAVRTLLKNLRIGVQEATIDKVWPGLVKSFSVALAETLKGFEHVKYPVRVEPKLDGLRIIAVINDGTVKLYSRNGRLLASHDGVKHEGTMPQLCEALVRVSKEWNVVLDGEGLADGNWNDSASVIMSSTNAKDDSGLVFNVFDAVPYEVWVEQETSCAYSERCEAVEKIVKAINSDCVKQVPHIIASSEKGLRAFYSKCMDEGYEGVMLKTVDTPYLFKRSSNILKLKPVTTYEGVIIGCYTGRVNTKNEGLFGGFEVMLTSGAVTRVGGGYTDSLRAEIQLKGAETFVGKIVEIEAQPDPLTENGLTVDGRARFPVFIRFRDECDVSSEVLGLKNYLA